MPAAAVSNISSAEFRVREVMHHPIGGALGPRRDIIRAEISKRLVHDEKSLWVPPRKLLRSANVEQFARWVVWMSKYCDRRTVQALLEGVPI